MLKEYTQFVDDSGGAKSPFSYPKALLRSAFEHLLALGLVYRTDSKHKLREQVGPYLAFSNVAPCLKFVWC